MANKNAKILVVDDDSMISSCLRQYFLFQGYDAQIAQDGGEAVQWLRENTCDLVITDINMPFMNGIELLQVARKICPGTIFFVMTGVAENDLVEQAIEAGASTVLTKPFTLDGLDRLIKEHLAPTDFSSPGPGNFRENRPCHGRQNPCPGPRPAVFC